MVYCMQILDYSKIELDHLELSQDSVQLRSVLESSMDMLAERAASKSVELTLVMEQVDISIIGDLTREFFALFLSTIRKANYLGRQVYAKLLSTCCPSEQNRLTLVSSPTAKCCIPSLSAVKFTQEGEIVVTAFSEPVEKTTKGEGMSRVTISVQDTGIGIAKENLPKLFR